MTARARTLKQLVDQSLYPVDTAAVAEAIVLRAAVRRVVPDVELHAAAHDAVRSFRRDARARSFRLELGHRR